MTYLQLSANVTRRQVGAVIVIDNVVVSTGYNGSAKNLPHCDEVGCDMDHGHCVRTIHAEVNAILQAAKRGIAIEGGIMYTTTSPCWNCFKTILNAGIKEVVFKDSYENDRVKNALSDLSGLCNRIKLRGIGVAPRKKSKSR
jgi:dCMP deaminase